MHAFYSFFLEWAYESIDITNIDIDPTPTRSNHAYESIFKTLHKFHLSSLPAAVSQIYYFVATLLKFKPVKCLPQVRRLLPYLERKKLWTVSPRIPRILMQKIQKTLPKVQVGKKGNPSGFARLLHRDRYLSSVGRYVC